MSTTTNIKLFKHDNPSTNTDEFNVDKALNQNWDKVDTAIGKDRGRITTLETDNTTNKKDITDIKAKNTEQDKYIAELEAENIRIREDLNGLPKGQVSGESIDLSDSAEMRCELKIGGNSKQETRSGKNKLLNDKPTGTLNGVTFTRDNSGIITANGTATDAIVCYLGSKFKTIEAGTYKLSDGRNDESNSTYFTYMDCYNTDGSAYQNGNLSTVGTSAIKYTEPKMIKGRIVIRKGTTLNNIVFKPQLELVNSIDDKSTDYEQYGASPSPDYPSEVECVTGDVNLTICNKNLAKINETDWTLTDNNTIKNKAKNSGSVLTEFYLKKGQTVKISLKLMSKPTEDSTLTIYINGKDTNMISSFSKFHFYDIEKIYTRTYTATEDCTISFKLWGNSNSDIFEFQFWAELDNVTEYEEHKEQNYILHLGDLKLCKKDDYTDTFINKNNKWYKRENILSYIFTGNENLLYVDNNKHIGFNISNIIKNMYFPNPKSHDNVSLAYCNIYKIDTSTNTMKNENKNIIAFSYWEEKSQWAYFSKSQGTIDEIKAQIKGAKLIYVSSVPTDIEITDETLINDLNTLEKEAKTYKNVTHIYSTDEISPNVEVTYKIDLDSRLNNIEQAILSQGGNI